MRGGGPEVLILFGIAMDTKLSDFRLALRKPKAFAVAIGAELALGLGVLAATAALVHVAPT